MLSCLFFQLFCFSLVWSQNQSINLNHTTASSITTTKRTSKVGLNYQVMQGHYQQQAKGSGLTHTIEQGLQKLQSLFGGQPTYLSNYLLDEDYQDFRQRIIQPRLSSEMTVGNNPNLNAGLLSGWQWDVIPQTALRLNTYFGAVQTQPEIIQGLSLPTRGLSMDLSLNYSL